jgi:uncharacterized protein YgbK (DUF1537 family)
MTKRNSLLLTFYGDDFTGATDALESLTCAGAKTALFIDPPSPAVLARYPGLQALGVGGMTRSLGSSAIEAELRPALAALKALGAPHVHYKVCSTFDSSPAVGSIGRAIDVAARIFKPRFVPLLVGAPSLGRHCVFGNLFAMMGIGSGGPIYRLDRHPSMSRHPITPADEADLRVHLAKQTKKPIGLFDILKVALPAKAAHAALEGILAAGAEVVLFDLLYASQLESLGRLLDRYASHEQPLFWVGSSGVEMALGAHWNGSGRLQPRHGWVSPGRAGPLLAASGSCSPVTAGQIAWAQEHGFAEVPLEPSQCIDPKMAAAAVAAAAAAAASHLEAGRSTIIHTSRGQVDRRIGALPGGSAAVLGAALGRAVRGAIAKVRVQRIAIVGGDTSSYAARALGIEAVEMIAPLMPGGPLCRAHAPRSLVDGLEIVFKSGQAGGADYFGVVARGKL